MNLLKKFIAFFKLAGTTGKISIVLCFVNVLMSILTLFYKFEATIGIMVIDGFLIMFCGISFSKLTKELKEINSQNFD